MKLYRLLTTSLLTAVLMGSALLVNASQDRVFGFVGDVNAFDRSNGTIIIEDLLFRTSESTIVRKKNGSRGTLSDLIPGTKIGFYPQGGENSLVDQVWILPSNWSANPGFADGADN